MLRTAAKGTGRKPARGREKPLKSNERRYMLQYWKKSKKKKEPKTIYGQEPPKKRKPDLGRKLDRVFALYVRLRDVMPNGYGKCISCGRIKHFKDLDCGHFYSRVHRSVRWDEDNAHAECSYCNRMSADHLIAYQTNLIRKIGMGRFEVLGARAHQTKKWSDFELEALIKHYTAEVRRLSAEKGIKASI